MEKDQTILERIKESIDAGWSIHVACRQAGVSHSYFYKRSFKDEQYKEVFNYYSEKRKEVFNSRRPYRVGINP